MIQNGFTTKNNKEKYDYIINNVYKLPFKDNIKNNIDKEINRLFKKKVNIIILINIFYQIGVVILKIVVYA